MAEHKYFHRGSNENGIRDLETILTCKRRPKMDGFLKAAHGILVFLLILVKHGSETNGRKKNRKNFSCREPK